MILAGAMFVIGGAILSCGFAKPIGDKILKHIKGERNVMLVLMIIGTLMAAFITGISTISILTPLLIGICQSNKEYRLSKLLIPCFVACETGGMLTLIGKPSNMVAAALLAENGFGKIGFFAFAKIGLPISISLILFMYFWGYKLMPDNNVAAGRFTASNAAKDIKPVKKILCLIVFLAVIIMMAFGNIIDMPSQIIALFGILFLFIFGIIKDRQAFSFINWSAVFIIAGMLPLAGAMVKTGAADMIAEMMISVIGQNPSPVLLAAVIFVFIGIMTEFMSNTACCTLFAPIGLVLASRLNIDPVNMVIAIGIASACAFAMPVGSPIAAYIMGFGDYKIRQYVKAGIPLDIIGWGVSIIAVGLFWMR